MQTGAVLPSLLLGPRQLRPAPEWQQVSHEHIADWWKHVCWLHTSS